jgi:hypothetical protein
MKARIFFIGYYTEESEICHSSGNVHRSKARERKFSSQYRPIV